MLLCALVCVKFAIVGTAPGKH